LARNYRIGCSGYLARIEGGLMPEEVFTILSEIDARLRSCEVSLARTDERVEQLHTFALKAYRFGLAICAVVLGIDIGPMIGAF
jgi:hypothetical protein